MNNITKLLRTCRIATQVYCTSFVHIPRHLTALRHRYIHISAKDMAQRSIMSFFKASPPKPEVKEEKVDEEERSSAYSDVETSFVSNGKLRGSTKRARLESSESDSASPKKSSTSPQVSSDKKKKAKRQRIESSGSEAETPPASSPKQQSPASSPTSTPTPEQNIKLEKIVSPKTYASPKSKKKKALTEQNGIKSPPKSVKKEKITPKKGKESAKKDKKVIEKDVKSTAVVSEEEVEVKQEKNDSTTETESKVEGKKEKGGNEKGDDTKITAEGDYNPSKSKYHPITDACWARGKEVPYIALTKTFELIEATSSRLKMIEILSNYMRSVIVLTPEDLLPSVYMCLNQLAPAHHSLELGIAETYLMKAIGQCTGRTLAQVKAAASKTGDLGAVGEQARAAQRTMFAPPTLSVRRVFAALRDVAHMSGQASVNKKINKIQTLYVACKPTEARYLIRSLEGKLRIGLAEQSVLQALALATTMTPPAPHGDTVLDASKGLAADEFKALVDANSLTIKTTYCECPNYEQILPALLRHGVQALPQHCRLAPGAPLKPMLAHPTKSLSEVFDRFEKESFTCEWKYDGERAQIHVPGEDSPDLEHAAVFSRNQENNTSKYPDIIRRLPALLKPSVTSCVLDCEAVAYDTDKKQILPFQVLSTRKRKDASEADIKVRVCVFVFDVLFLNGRALVRQPLQARRAALHRHFNEVDGEWQFAAHADCSTLEQLQASLEAAVRGSCEGLMVKALRGPHAQYDIARRSHNWLKLKKDYLSGLGDSLDVVVIGAYLGRGKRAGLFGGFLLACYEPHADEYQTLCKIGTGFSDEDLKNFTETLKQHVIDEPRSYYRYDQAHAADVWVSAGAVWEVRCADLSLSPAHRAAIGLVAHDKGISLRFPRFVRVREDKTPEQATTAQQIADMYLAQDQVRNCAKPSARADDFY